MEKEQLEEQLMYAYWFHGNHFAGNRTMWRLSEEIGTPKQIYECDGRVLAKFLTKKQTEHLLDSKRTWNVEEKWEELEREKICFLPNFHADYPEYLRAIPDPPWGLYLKGRFPDCNCMSAAVVGARQCSEYGKILARKIGGLLDENGIPVISGMARGIDGISQSAALNAGGESLAVLGCGVDIYYPKENRVLYAMLEKQGGILSEYPPGTQPVAINFPPRNRIISGLCDVLIVIEAKEKSGTLITVDMALEQGKEVFALPGRITDALSAGCNNLIRQGAGILTSLEELFQILGIEKKNLKQGMSLNGIEKQVLLKNEKEKRLYGILEATPKNIEQIWAEYGMERLGIQQLMQMLLEFCMKGIAAQTGGCYYRVL